MKKIVAFIFVLMLFANATKAQYVNIPDSNFRKVLIQKYPNCFNSVGQMDTTCAAIVNEVNLFLDSKGIASLDGLIFFKNLRLLWCEGNYLKKISLLPTKLNIIKCSFNQIDSLPKLPDSLVDLICISNRLKMLPELPKTLINLNCYNNVLDNLPQLPNSLLYLDVSFNHFSYIDKLPESLITLVAWDSFPLCFGKLPQKLKGLFANYGTSVRCFPNYPDSCTYVICSSPMCPQTPPVGICNPTNNPNHCQAFPTVQSFVYLDANNNNKFDSGEFVKSNIKLSLSNKAHSYTNENGVAETIADSLGTHTITANTPVFYNAVPPNYTYNFSSYDTIVYDTFALEPNELIDSLSIVATPLNFAARPGFKYAYNVQYENVGTTFLSPSINFSYDNNLLIYDSSSNNAVVNNGSSLSLSQGIFAPGQTGSFTAYFKVKTTAILGTNLLSVANIGAGNCNSVDSITTVVRGSYDPNDKYATPTLTLQDVANRKYINYTIRFQNTGTDTAFNVVISDSLSGYLKINNLKGITSSHPCKFTLKNGVAYFEFVGINLPDSNTNKLACNGFVKFQILADESVAAGTVIPNKAYIYFDYNKAIITNIATTTILNPLPLTLVDFGALPKSTNEISVYWTTANEINTKYFIIETSFDGSNFKPAAELPAIGFGDNTYSYPVSSATVAYIRLKVVDKDGKVAYSKIVKIAETKNLGITISPNPAKNYLHITLNKTDFSNTSSKLINSMGMVVKSFILKPGPQSIDINDLAIGVYYLQTGLQTIKVFVEK